MVAFYTLITRKPWGLCHQPWNVTLPAVINVDLADEAHD
jgi:hypothetical protein